MKDNVLTFTRRSHLYDAIDKNNKNPRRKSGVINPVALPSSCSMGIR